MSPKEILLIMLIYTVLAAGMAYVFNRILRRRNFGGLWGAVIAGIVGAAIGSFAFDWICVKFMDLVAVLMGLVNWLMKNADTELMPPVNIVAAFLGCLVLILVLQRLSPGD